MVYRVSRDDARRPRGGPTGALALLLVLAVVLGVWFFAGREPGSPTGALVQSEPLTAGTLDGLPRLDVSALPDDARDLFGLVRSQRPQAPAGAPFVPTDDDVAAGFPQRYSDDGTVYVVTGEGRLVAALDGQWFWLPVGSPTWYHLDGF
ncbi:hypothetical protein [Nocardioides acrostichi]|uniref:Uncharacterized protein n=1 Tax=Nocardioides acrostichi TaxID=2784339 RepID=A0A930UTK6_9ACTN|nr:hypothetical protein [Nocardioides acrostichi]MBF4160588.1 hypothetical protein [Nocardioides acrostichi]